MDRYDTLYLVSQIGSYLYVFHLMAKSQMSAPYLEFEILFLISFIPFPATAALGLAFELVRELDAGL